MQREGISQEKVLNDISSVEILNRHQVQREGISQV